MVGTGPQPLPTRDVEEGIHSSPRPVSQKLALCWVCRLRMEEGLVLRT